MRKKPLNQRRPSSMIARMRNVSEGQTQSQQATGRRFGFPFPALEETPEDSRSIIMHSTYLIAFVSFDCSSPSLTRVLTRCGEIHARATTQTPSNNNSNKSRPTINTHQSTVGMRMQSSATTNGSILADHHDQSAVLMDGGMLGAGGASVQSSLRAGSKCWLGGLDEALEI